MRTIVKTLAITAAASASLLGCELGDMGKTSSSDVRLGTFPGPDGPLRAPYVVEGDFAIVGGDMLWPTHSLLGYSAASSSGPAQRWPGGVVVYQMPANFAKATEVKEAVAIWNALTPQTGVKIVERTDQTDYIAIDEAQKESCSSQVGFQGGVQRMNLQGWCTTAATVHEFGHAIGLVHEHSRPDRDKFVEIDFANIKGGRESQMAKVNFAIISGATTYGAYDPMSIMHYAAYLSAPSIIDSSKPVFKSKIDGVSEDVFGQEKLSARDIAGVGQMYRGAAGECQSDCTSFGLAEGECKALSTGSYQCTAGCMQKVAACEGGTGDGGGENFTCTNGQTVPAAYQCDSVVDCSDGSDEANCGGGTDGGGTDGGGTDGGGNFMCTDGTTIPTEYQCDNIVDCPDGSDENSCGGGTGGGGGTDGGDVFTCTDGTTIPASYQCDNFLDCPDSSDEANCGGTGGGGTGDNFTCTDGTTIPASYKCDSIVDCPDSSDEANCAGDGGAGDGGTGGGFTCTDGTTIPAEYQCDTVVDCPDSSDEAGCA